MKAIKYLWIGFFLFFGMAGAVDSLTVSDSLQLLKLQEEILLRDSLLSQNDSLFQEKEAALRKELETEQAKCGNWEQSWNTLKEDHGKCTKALRVAIDSQMKTGSKANKETIFMTSSSFLGGLVLGFLIAWFAL